MVCRIDHNVVRYLSVRNGFPLSKIILSRFRLVYGFSLPSSQVYYQISCRTISLVALHTYKGLTPQQTFPQTFATLTFAKQALQERYRGGNPTRRRYGASERLFKPPISPVSPVISESDDNRASSNLQYLQMSSISNMSCDFFLSKSRQISRQATPCRERSYSKLYKVYVRHALSVKRVKLLHKC